MNTNWRLIFNKFHFQLTHQLINHQPTHTPTNHPNSTFPNSTNQNIQQQSPTNQITPHLKLFPGWLEPIIDAIEANEEDVVMSVMDIINDKTLEYKLFNYDSINIGGFTWSLGFTWIGVPPRVKKGLKSAVEPIRYAGWNWRWCWKGLFLYINYFVR